MSDRHVRERTVDTGDVELHVLEAGTPGHPVVLLSHGFPELGYSWRHQLPALAEAGYHVLAPDQRGYGRSSCPEAVEAYGIRQLTGDLVALLDDIGADQGVVVGHDWGSMVASHLTLLHPARISGLVNMSVPHLPRGPMPPVQMMRQVLGDNFFYILYFQEPGVADAELGADADRTMRRLLCGAVMAEGAVPDPANFANDGRGFVDRIPEPVGLPDWLLPAELDHYVEEFSRTGFTGGINWYRNMDRNWAGTEALAGAKVEVPSLFIGGRLDPVLLMTPP
ncbi:MAG TPA: alpha/beta fold hydrolase, partial [Acidimicrobiales bacterium]|nr:alpha/beta fold hydrolase [Acidimicrobiales bacterium]